MYQLLSNGVNNWCNHSLQRNVESNLETQIFGAIFGNPDLSTLKGDVGAMKDVLHEKAISHKICANRSWHLISCQIRLIHFLAFVFFPSPLAGRPRCHLQILYS